MRKRAGRPRKLTKRFPSGRIKYVFGQKKQSESEAPDALTYCLQSNLISQSEYDAGQKLLELRRVIFGKMEASTASYKERIAEFNKHSSSFQISILNETDPKHSKYQIFCHHVYFGAINKLKKNNKNNFYNFEKYIIFDNKSENLKLYLKSDLAYDLLFLIRTNLQILENYFHDVFSG